MQASGCSLQLLCSSGQMDEEELGDYQDGTVFDGNNSDNETQGSPLSYAEYGTFFPLSPKKWTMFFSTLLPSVNSDGFFDQPETDKLSGFNHRSSTKNSLNSQYLRIGKIKDGILAKELQHQIYKLIISEFNRLQSLGLPGNIAIEIVLGNFSYDTDTHSIYCTVCAVNKDYSPNQADETDFFIALKHNQKCKLKRVTVCRLFDPEQWEKPEVTQCKCGLEKSSVISDENSLIHLFALRKSSSISCLATANTLNPGLWHPHHHCWRIM